MTRVAVHCGDLVCLTNPHEEVACRGLMAQQSEMSSQPKWNRSASGNATTTFYDARVTVFAGRQGGFTFVVTDGEVSAYSRAFASMEEAKSAAARSLSVMRETGSWRDEWRANQDAQVRRQIALTHDLADLEGEFSALQWEEPNHETELAWGWMRDDKMHWLPKSVIYESADPDLVLIRRSWLQDHGCPLEERTHGSR